MGQFVKERGWEFCTAPDGDVQLVKCGFRAS